MVDLNLKKGSRMGDKKTPVKAAVPQTVQGSPVGPAMANGPGNAAMAARLPASGDVGPTLTPEGVTTPYLATAGARAFDAGNATNRVFDAAVHADIAARAAVRAPIPALGVTTKNKLIVPDSWHMDDGLVHRPQAPGGLGVTAAMGVMDTVLSGKNLAKDISTLTNDKASFDDKARAGGSVGGNGMGAVGGVASIFGAGSIATPLGVGALGNSLAGAGDQRMGRSLDEGGFGIMGSDWAADLGHDVSEGLGGGALAQTAGFVATGAGAVAATVPAIGQGFIAGGEGAGSLACDAVDCDGAYADKLADYRAGNEPLHPKAVAARTSAVGTCYGEDKYDTGVWAKRGEVVPRGPDIPSFGSFDRSVPGLGPVDPSLPMSSGQGGDIDTALIAEFLQNMP